MAFTDQGFIATITANGQIYSAWESVRIRRDFGDGISVFQFTPAEGSYGPSYSGMKLQPGDAVTIALGGQTVITGYVTTRSGAFDKDAHQLVIAGKSKTCDLKDSSVVVQPGNFNGSSFQQAAQGVMAPHPVQLVMMNAGDAASKPFETLAVQYGETVGEFVSRIAAVRGLFLTDDENGNLVAGQGDPSAGSVAELREGGNIKRCTFLIDDQTAFSKWSGTSQQPGNDQNWPSRANSASVQNNDSTRQNRTKLFIAQHPMDADELATNVNHEVVRSSWQKFTLSVTVVGWFKPDGSLWKPTQNVSVYSPMAFPTQDGTYPLAIQAVTWSQDSENGTETTLELVLPNLLTSVPTAGVSDLGNADPTAAQPDSPN